MEYKLINGNSLEVLKTFKENTFDSIVTDPPYEIGFMNKSWDSSGIAFNKELWKECLRVLKPGGHLIAFSSARTYHRVAVAVEDSGFEIRDQMLWIYKNGFPKNLNISLQMDKNYDSQEDKLKFVKWFRTTELKEKQINKILNKTVGGHYLANSQAMIPSIENFELLKPFIKIEIPDFINDLIYKRNNNSENFLNREIIEYKKTSDPSSMHRIKREKKEIAITKPFSEEAKKWEGWGTALKPAHEPIILARKPISENNIKNNILKHNTGAINVEASKYDNKYPSNIFCDENLDLEHLKYFYCPKINKQDKNEGLENENTHPTIKPTELMSYLVKLVTPTNGTVLDPFNGSGSTGKACARENFNYVGIDLSQEYLDISKARIEYQLNK